MRGDLVSRPIGEVMREAESLVKSGVKELLVVSQDTSAYGVDLKYRTDFVAGRPVKTRFAELAKELGELGVWVRMHYVYPYPHVDEVLGLMADNKILPYLDVPFQHSHPDVLKRMKRPASGEKNMERIAGWRAIAPNLTIRSTFIAGFPGETEAEFAHLKEFLGEAQLDRVGVFAYSPVDGASANALPGSVEEPLRNQRRDELMALQEGISFKRQKAKLGSRQKVIIDAASAEGYMGRSMADAPEIDGQVHMPKPAKAWLRPKVGDIVTVKVSGHDAYDLSGEIV
jgi:ribosomal protein S12 methylthiotransferase